MHDRRCDSSQAHLRIGRARNAELAIAIIAVKIELKFKALAWIFGIVLVPVVADYDAGFQHTCPGCSIFGGPPVAANAFSSCVICRSPVIDRSTMFSNDSRVCSSTIEAI